VTDPSPGPAAPERTSLFRSLVNQVDRLWHEVAKFGIVGLCAFVIDVGLFNLLRFAGGDGPLYDKPLTAKVISVAVATTFAYFGNRYWTFRHRGRTSFGREYLLFFVLNGVGMLISVTCLWFSHYALGFTSPLADNISANVVGLALGTMFRFWSYRRWVFPDDAEAADDAAVSTTA
jgi:putative flippase GtrA